MIWLKRITMEDTDDVILWRNHKDTKKFFLYQEDISKEEHIDWLKNKVFCGLCEQFIIMDGKKKTGSVYLRDIDYNSKTAEFGIFLNVESRGNGIGKNATNLILEYAFNIVKLEKVFLRVLNFNNTAIEVYKKSGFRLDSAMKQTVIIDGIDQEVIFMSICKKDWCENE